MSGHKKLDPNAVVPCFHCLFLMYGPPLRVERVPVSDVRAPVTRGTGVRARYLFIRLTWATRGKKGFSATVRASIRANIQQLGEIRAATDGDHSVTGIKQLFTRRAELRAAALAVEGHHDDRPGMEVLELAHGFADPG